MTPLLPAPPPRPLLSAGPVRPRYAPPGRNRSPFAPDTLWLSVPDGDPRAFDLYKRHYSYYHYKRQRTNRLIVGPGEKMVLLTYHADALFAWRKFIDDSGQTGVNCAVFRNESTLQSSRLIKEAMRAAWQRWPGERLYTYVHPAKIKSRNPGYCFKKAGWRVCGETKGGLIILEVRPKTPAVIYLPAHVEQLTEMTVRNWLAGPAGIALIGPGGLVYLDVA